METVEQEVSAETGRKRRERYRLARNMTLPLPLLLALRYLKSTRRDAFVTFLSLLATVGIALGVAALVFVLALLAGLQSFLRTDILARTPHIEISWGEGVEPEVLAARLRDVDGVEDVRQILRGRGWMLSDDRPVDVEVIGFEGELPRFFPRPTSAEPGLYIDHVTAARWGLGSGDFVEIVSPRPTLTPFGPQPRIVKLRITGSFESGRTEGQDRRLAVPISMARRLFGDRQSRLEVQAASFEEALEIAPRLQALLPEGSELRTWKDLNRGLFFALRLEKLLMFAAVFLIMPVAAMSLVTVLGILISSKRAEIGMLQAMGARPEELRRAFMVLGGLLGSFGLGLGSALGLLAAWLCDRYQLVKPPGDVYFIDHVPFLVEAGDFAAVVGTSSVLVLAATVYTAYRAASMRAVEALRL